MRNSLVMQLRPLEQFQTFFFYENILHAQKAQKAQKAQRHNQAKAQKAQNGHKRVFSP